jgi:hypothetical protein
MRLFFRELTASDAVVSFYEFLWESWIFESPEAKIAWF